MMTTNTAASPYRVHHEKSGERYYVLAGSPEEAIEIVTLRLGDAEGAAAWSASSETPAYGLANGVVLDSSGKPVTSAEA